MNKETEIQSSVEKDCIVNNEKLSEESEIIQNEDGDLREKEINILKNHLKKLLYNSYIVENYDKNLLNLKIEFFINLKDYVKKVKGLKANLKNIENFNIDVPEVFVTNIEFILFLLKNISKDNIENFSLENFLFSLKKISFEKNIKNFNNHFVKIITDADLKEYFEKMISSVDVILEKNNESNLQNEILNEEESIEEIRYKLSFNFLEEIYQESEILLSLTNSFLKYTLWLESLLEVILEEKTQEILDEKMIILLEKIFKISEKILKNKIINFDSDEMTNSLNEAISLSRDIQKNYSKIVNLDKVYNFSNNYLVEKFPHLEGNFEIFVLKEKKKEYIKDILNILEELNKSILKRNRRNSFSSFFYSENTINEDDLELIKKCIKYFNLINRKNLSTSELEEFELIKKINVEIEKKQQEYRNKTKELKEIDNLSEYDVKMLQEYENALYWFRLFKRISKKFIIFENKEDKEIQNVEVLEEK